MKLNRLVALITAVIISSAGLAFGTTAYDTVILGDSPVSYWPMQETVGPTIHDSVSTNAGPFNGTLQISTDGFANGAVDGQGKNWGIIHETFTNSTSTAATDGATYLFGGPGGLPGVSGDKAIYFTNLNGQLNNAQIVIGTGSTGAYEAQLDSSTFTAEAWINVPTYTIGWTSNSYQVPLGLNAYGNSGGTANGWFMGVKTDSSGSAAYGEMFFDAGTGTAYTSNGPSAQVFSGKWVYAVQEYNGTATVIYTNGTLMASNAQTYKPLSNSSTHELPFIIGSETAYYFGGSTFSGNTRADFWDGGISHLAYFNYALSAGKVLAHYQAASSGISPPPTTPVLSIQKSGTSVTLNWTNGFLQVATNVQGPWMNVLPTNETSPQVIAATNSQLFFRASSEPLVGPVTNPPSITTQPANQTNYVTATATFTVTAAGTPPLSYQWQVESNGVYANLGFGGQFGGEMSATLTIIGLVPQNATNYEVVVTNSAGSVTSAVAALTVLGDAPSITAQPASQTNTIGQTAIFTVTTAGLVPLSYQWQVESNGVYSNLSAGGQFSGVTNATLSISTLAQTNATNYEVVVTNSYGSVTSTAAALTIGPPTYDSAILSDLPVSYWPMQETTGPIIHDVVSTNNGTLMTSTDGTILGNNQHTNFVTAGAVSTDGSTYHLGGPGGLSSVPGDKAVYFTNLNSSVNNSQIVVPYNPTLDPSSNLTAEAWVKVPTYPIGYTKTTNQVPLGFDANGGAENGWWISFETDAGATNAVQGDLQFDMAYSPGLWISYPPISTTTLAGQWVYVVEVYDGSNSNLICYTNGAQMALAAMMTTNYESEGLYGSHKLPFVIGSFSSPGGGSGGYNGGGMLATGFERGNFWHGGISHVAIYNYALTPSQIVNHYFYGLNIVTNNPPSITTPPASQTNFFGETATLTVNAVSISPISYQWQVESNGVYVNPGEGGQFSSVTNTTFSISNLTANNATNYDVVVGNSFGSVTSAPATLTIVSNIMGGAPKKIMCIGDSITQMDVCDWRPDLANELTAAGYNYVMVGRQQGTACPKGQNANEGWSGYTTTEILNIMPAMLAANVPDIAMVHIGINDLSHAVPNQTAINLAAIIQTLQASNKNMIIVCSQIIPCELCPSAWEYDYLVPTINAALSTPTSPVITADVFDNFDCYLYFNGGSGPHPGAAGGQFMCNVYYPIITSILDGIIPTRPPLPPAFPAPSGYTLCSFDNYGGFTVNFPNATNVAWGTPQMYGSPPTNINGTYTGTSGGPGGYYFYTNVSGNFTFDSGLGNPAGSEENFGYCTSPGIGIPGIPATKP